MIRYQDDIFYVKQYLVIHLLSIYFEYKCPMNIMNSKVQVDYDIS